MPFKHLLKAFEMPSILEVFAILFKGSSGVSGKDTLKGQLDTFGVFLQMSSKYFSKASRRPLEGLSKAS